MARPTRPFSSSLCGSFHLAAAFSWRPGWSRRWIFSRTCDSHAETRLAAPAAVGSRMALLDYLASLRFTGDVDAMPEGTVFFANEPILRVTAPLPEAQLVETRLINILHFQSLIASKAARIGARGAGQAAGRFRPAPRAWRRSRADGRARKLYRGVSPAPRRCSPERHYGIPLFGTMAHSFIQAHDDEAAAFREFCPFAAGQSRPC